MSKTAYIFYVGKPYPHKEALDHIRSLGFNIGVFLDKRVELKNQELYDAVVPIDFTKLKIELPRIVRSEFSIAGLLCTYENYIPAKAQIGELLNLPAIGYASAQLCTDKYRMRQAFTAYDPSITPRFHLVSTLEDAIRYGEELGYPVILKPTNLVKSLLVLRCNSREELIDNFTYAQRHIAPLYKKYNISQEPQLILEQYIVGKTCSIAAFVDDRGKPHFCDDIVELKNAQDIGVNDNYLYKRLLPATLPASQKEQLFAVAQKGIAALGMRSTAAHVELIYNDHETKLIEIGARIGGYRPRMYAYSYGVDLIAQEVAVSLGKTPHPRGTFQQYSATYELFPHIEGNFVTLGGQFDTKRFAYFNQKVTPGQWVGLAKNGYKAAAIVMVAHQDKQTFDTLCQEVETISVEVQS